MGTVELLPREGEIELAKRIEDGIRESIVAIASCPATIGEVLRMMDLVEAEQMRLTDLVVDFIDPNAKDEPLPEIHADDEGVPAGAKAKDKDDEESEDGGTTAEEDTGPDRDEALRRFARIRKLHASLAKALDKNGFGAPEA